ncbi:hypothetical protein SBP18_14440 [Rhodoferax ferrireducens]|uniref:hypothetical protein n=1 Tax=Rhodoferax ferrireducens TaxID=192843 RepID=UPI00298E98CE|nr:hypothetical protein [Rhodoferax ferrireducens]WPC65681.1 hypothetical protein SBP18_14440 [Rhodoferax ferrireducens]
MRLPNNFYLTTETLASAVLILTWLVVMRSTRYSKWQLALISLPGTVMHEALHGMVGLVLFAKPKSFSIFPKRERNTWVLGSVGFGNLNIWNAAPVAFAPLVMIGIGWLLYVNWMLPTFHAANYLIWIVSGYVTACAFFSCIPSTTDIKVGAVSGLMYGGIGFGVWYFVH